MNGLSRYEDRATQVPLYPSFIHLRAEDGAQTRDPQLGRLMLYQLSYFRILCDSTYSLAVVGRLSRLKT